KPFEGVSAREKCYDSVTKFRWINPIKTNLIPLWKNIAEAISAQVSRDTFQRWFQGIELLDADENDLLLGVPNNIYQLWIEMNYMPLVHSAIATVVGTPRTVRFTADHDSEV